MAEDRLDPRMNDTDRRLMTELDETAPGVSSSRSAAEGLVGRVLEASLPLLAEGRSRGPRRLRLTTVAARLAVAAGLALAIVLGFWAQPAARQFETTAMPIALAPGDRPTGALVAAGPFQWRDGAMLTLMQVQDMDWQDALGDLETVVNTVRSGQSTQLGIIADDTPLERVESELLTVANITGGAS
ncbi:MAG: hypothetical protein MK101_00615 [Phycisphaerales bacterium]|nr:hypothetical protein [Phycisphaerales bacterium]